MTTKPRVAVVISPRARHENINDIFFQLVGDRFDIVLQESEKPTTEELEALIRDADALVTGWGTPEIPDDSIDRAQKLKLVVHAQGGVKRVIPHEAIIRKGILLTNSAHAYARTMCESTIGLMLALGYHMRFSHEKFVYRQDQTFDRLETLGIGLDGKTIGIVGFGPIGSLLAQMLATFNVRLIGYDPYIDLTLARRLNVTMLDSIEEIAEQSDILTVHCGWTKETTGLVTRRALERLGPRAMLIVNSRMPIVDEDALCELVKAQRLYAALNLIPLRTDLWLDPVFQALPNVLFTHGSSNVSDTWHNEVAENVATQLLNFFSGRPVTPLLTLEGIARST